MSNLEEQSDSKKKAFSAVLWNGAEHFMRQGLQFVVAVILARILSPEDFGTIALLYLFTGIASVFIDSGFSAALVQRQDITHIDESTVFWFNLAMSILVAALLLFFAPLIAVFFSVPVLIPLIKVISLSLILNALGSIQMILLTKRLDFKTLMKIGVVSTFVSGAIAILLAVNGFGIWALAYQTVAASLVSTILLWLFSSWRPHFEFSMTSLKRLFAFGSYLMLSALLDVAYNRVYSLLIGKMYGVRDLGFYSRAENTKQIPVDLLSNTLSRVAFPIFSAAAHDKEKLRRGVQLALRGIMLINVPIMIGLMVTAENAVYVVFGEKWLPAVSILQVLCIAGIFWPLHAINLNVLMAQGHSNLFFRLEVVKKVVGIIFLIIGISFGIMGIVWSQVASGFFGFIVNAYYTKQHLEYGVLRQTIDFLPVLLVAIVMAIFVYAIDNYSAETPFVTLSLQVVSGASIFLIISVTVKLRAYRDCINLVRHKLN